MELTGYHLHQVKQKNKENLLEIDGLNLMKQLPQKTTDETIMIGTMDPHLTFGRL